MPDLPARGEEVRNDQDEVTKKGSLELDTEAYRNIIAVLRGTATKNVLRYEINNRSLMSRSISELRELAGYFARQIRYAETGNVIRIVE